MVTTRRSKAITKIRSIKHTFGVKWIICKNKIDVIPSEFEEFNKLITKKGVNIFNPDKKRKQVVINETAGSFMMIRQIKTILTEFSQGRIYGDISIIKSFAGCAKQHDHYDYDPNVLKEHENIPFGILIALQPETNLYVDDKQVTLQKGEIFVFDGDLLHAGGDYTADNLRIHMYLDTSSSTRQMNKTYLAIT